MRSIFCLLLASFLFMSATNPTTEGIEFFQGSFTSAKAKASQEGKLFFLDFTASWCTPCRWMEETTFTDPTLAAYVKTNYVALQVDIDDFDGFALKQEYNIQILPSLLVFNSSGNLLGQYEESLSPSRMLEILKQYDQPENRIASRPVLKPYTTNKPLYEQENTYQQKIQQNNYSSNYTENQPSTPTATTTSTLELPSTFIVNTTDVETTPVDYTSSRPQAVGTTGNISRNRLVRKEEIENPNYNAFEGVVEMPTQNATTEEIPKPNLHTLPATFTSSNTSVESNYAAVVNETNEKPIAHLPLVDPYNDNGQGLYRLQVARQPSNGYSVQVGAYAEYGNVLKQASLMQQHFMEPVIVHISKNSNRSMYKLMLGEFDTRTAAINFMRTVQAKGVDCMIKDLSNH